MADKEMEFVDGLFVKAPHEKAPDFVKAQISIKVEDLGKWLRAKYKESLANEGWINLDVKESKSGRWYAAVSNYKPKAQEPERRPVPGGDRGTVATMDDDVPFSPIRNLEASAR
jgi:hypothetical protein